MIPRAEPSCSPAVGRGSAIPLSDTNKQPGKACLLHLRRQALRHPPRNGDVHAIIVLCSSTGGKSIKAPLRKAIGSRAHFPLKGAELPAAKSNFSGLKSGWLISAPPRFGASVCTVRSASLLALTEACCFTPIKIPSLTILFL